MGRSIWHTLVPALLLAGLHASSPAAYITPKGEPNFGPPRGLYLILPTGGCNSVPLGSVAASGCATISSFSLPVASQVQGAAPADSAWSSGRTTLYTGEPDEHYGVSGGALVSMSYGADTLTIHADILQDLDDPFVLVFGSTDDSITNPNTYYGLALAFYFDPVETVAAGTRFTFDMRNYYDIPSEGFVPLDTAQLWVIPEPGSLLLAGLGLAAAAALRRRR